MKGSVVNILDIDVDSLLRCKPSISFLSPRCQDYDVKEDGMAENRFGAVLHLLKHLETTTGSLESSHVCQAGT
jgi:hypothetical protein